MFNLIESESRSLSRRVRLRPRQIGRELSFVTPSFELDRPRPRTSKSAPHANLDNDWIYFNFALINDETGQAFDFGREVSYYHDSDGSEGSRDNNVVIPACSRRAILSESRTRNELQSASPLVRNFRATRRADLQVIFGSRPWLLLIPPFATVASLEPVRKRALARERLRARS